jgi:hypothetical protein
MAPRNDEPVLFAEPSGSPEGVVVINPRCRIQERGGYRVVSVGGLPLAHFAAGDRAGEAHAMVSLVDLGWGLVEMLPVVLEEVRKLVGDRRVTVVFDRGGWSPKLFAKLLADGFDLLTYRKAPYPRLPRSRFTPHKATLDGREIEYLLADQGIYLEYGRKKKRKRVHLRQVTRLSDDGHQTPIVTSRRDLCALEVAYRMFERWRQENFFKYLREEFALDALVDYATEPADATRDVPNPERKKINACRSPPE